MPGRPEAPDPQARERRALEHLTAALAEDVADEHTPDEVELAVEQAAHRYEAATVRDFVPILVEREVRAELRDAD
jgi:hypothetical protein